MALRMRDLLLGNFGVLRYEPTFRRVRAMIDGATLVDTQRALLVWEPRWVVPGYAVPVGDLHAELVIGSTVDAPVTSDITLATEGDTPGGIRIVPPGNFRAHTAPGDELSLRFGSGERPYAAFRLADPDLAGHVLLDFAAFDTWYEEEDKVIAHPRDPFHRVEVRRSSRSVRIERDGRVLAESRAPRLLFETHLPVRYYLPPGDVDLTRLRPSTSRTSCAYKGHASYWSYQGVGDIAPEDVAWSYPEPLPEASEVAGMIAFYDERVDVVVDGVRREQPATPWSKQDS